MKCNCGKTIPLTEIVRKCDNCKCRICPSCISGKVDKGQTFICPKCVNKYKPWSVIKVDPNIKGDRDGWVAWAIFDKTDNIIVFDVDGKEMMGYARNVEHIVRMCDRLLQDRFSVMHTKFYIGRVYISEDTPYAPLNFRLGAKDVRISSD